MSDETREITRAGRVLTAGAPDGCCVDCLMWLANGETDPGWTPERRAEFIAEFSRITEGCEVSLGMLREYHGCASNFTVTDVAGEEYEYRATDKKTARDLHIMVHREPSAAIRSITAHDLETESDRGGECECEQLGFSWSPCATCGSTLGGDRDAVTFWVPAESEGE